MNKACCVHSAARRCLQSRPDSASPTQSRGPVGEPPITRWDYPRFSVFFEYDTVLDTVIHRKQRDHLTHMTHDTGILSLMSCFSLLNSVY